MKVFPLGFTSCMIKKMWFYIGSTWNWVDRQWKHRTNSNNLQSLEHQYFAEVGYDRMVFEILEEREVQDREILKSPKVPHEGALPS